MSLLTRRAALTGSLAGGGLIMAGCSKITFADTLTASPDFQRALAAAEGWSHRAQRFIQGGGALAREYRLADLSPVFKANGTLHPPRRRLRPPPGRPASATGR